MTNREILAVIHARGGSKRIPLKNLVKVGGKPLVAYPIQLAKRSTFVTRTILSTDHDGIMEAGQAYGAEVPFRRPADISEDVPSELVTLHALEALEKVEGYRPEIVVTLTPATPFTTPELLDEAIRLLLAHPDWQSVVTVRKATEHPEWILRQDHATGMFKTILGNPLNGDFNVSQNLKPAYYPLGSFFINRSADLRQTRDLYGERFGAVVLSGKNHIDIDTPEDLAAAETMAKAFEASQ